MASFFLAPDPLQSTFFIPGGAVPGNGAQVFIYTAGSSTKVTVYKDNAGNSAWSNPIVLDSGGNLPSGGVVWIPSGVTIKAVWAPSNDTDPPSSPYRTIDNMAGVNDTTASQTEWIAGPTPTFISATSFSLVGDQTTNFHVGRRLKTTNTSGTVYSTITASAFGVVTTVTVANDTNTLDAGLSAASYSLISASNPSIDSDMVYRKGSAVTAAATTNVWAIVGDYVHIAGGTGITSFGTAPYAGCRRTLIHDAALTITNGTNLKCPGDQDLGVLANTVYNVIADTTTAHRIVNVTHAFSRPAQFPAKYMQGLTYSNNAGDATNDLDIASGSCRDSTDAMDMILTATITKQSDVAWAVGSGNGGLDTGAVGNSDYYIWLIKRSDTGVVDALYSLSSTAPTMPTNYDFKKLIGWFKRVGGSVVAFHTYETEGGGLELNWDVPTLDINLANTLTTARRTDAVKVPLNFTVEAHINIVLVDATTSQVTWIYCPDQTDAAPSTSAAPLANSITTSAANDAKQLKVRTSATGTIAARSSLATVDLYAASTIGFRWARRN